MKEIYTQKLLLFCCFLFLGAFAANAQNHTLTTTSGDSTKTYPLIISQVGSMQYAAPFAGELYASTSLACDTMVAAAAAGKIVLIDRGTCAFVIKYQAAVARGAAGVIICNNDTVNVNTILPVTGIALGSSAIPIFSASLTACKAIKASLASDTVTASIAPTGCAAPLVYDPSVFWGNIPGQGDFSNGIGDWTINQTGASNESFEFYNGNRPITGADNGGTSTFTSPTACNGIAAFSFVKFNLLNNPTLAGPPYYFSKAELISPTIDCSGKDKVSVEFYTINHRLNGNVSFAYSIDDGATWSEPEAIARSVIPANLITADKRAIPLNALINQPKCKIKFVADGDFYFFMLDDITLNSKTVYDMTISKDFYAGANNYATPFNQSTPSFFSLDIENIGNTPAQNVSVILDIYDATTDSSFVVHTDTIAYGAVPVGVRDADRVFSKNFTPEQKEAYYIAQYTLIADSVVLDADTDAQVDFETTNNYFSKIPDHPSVVNAWRAGGSTMFMSVAALYKVKNGTWPNGKAITLDYGRGGAAVNGTNVNTAAIVTYDVYKWVDTNKDTFNIQGDERQLLATGSVLIENSVDTVSIELFDPLDPSKKVVLPNEAMNLVAVVSVSPIDETGGSWFIGSVSPFNGDNVGRYHSYASGLAEINSGASAVWTGSFFGSGTLDDVATRVLEQSTLTAYAPLYFTEVDLVNNKEINKELKITAYPVPAVQNINVDLSFDKTEDYANVFITDMSGKIVHMEKHVNIQAKTLSINLSNFAAGVYNLRVNTDSGFNTQNFSVVK